MTLSPSAVSSPFGGCLLSVVSLAALPTLAMPVTWGRQESVSFAMYRAVARDLSSVIDRFSSLQIPGRVSRDEGVEVHQDFVFPEDGARIEIRVDRKANHLASVVNGVTAGGHGGDGAGKRAEVMYTLSLVHRNG
jgi:hypothetical protein